MAGTPPRASTISSPTSANLIAPGAPGTASPYRVGSSPRPRTSWPFIDLPRGGSALSILELDRGPQARVLADREVAAHAEELVLADVVRDLVGEAEPAVGLRVEPVQDRRRQEDLEGPAGPGEVCPRFDLTASGRRRVGDRAGDRLLGHLDDEA